MLYIVYLCNVHINIIFLSLGICGNFRQVFWKCLWAGSHISYGQGGQKSKLHDCMISSLIEALKVLCVLCASDCQ